MTAKQNIKTFLWFDNNAEEAVRFYTAIFKNSRITNVLRIHEHGAGPRGSVLEIRFQLAGQEFIALNGGPRFKFTEAISLFVDCDTQEEVDELWEKLSSGGGAPSHCGWLTDRFGLSWQIIPSALPRLLADGDRKRANRVMDAMLSMGKIDIAGLEQAHRGP